MSQSNGNAFNQEKALLGAFTVIIQLQTSRRFVITEKAPTRAFSWLKAATTAFTFKTLLRHYAKQALTPRSLNVKLGLWHNYHTYILLRDCTTSPIHRFAALILTSWPRAPSCAGLLCGCEDGGGGWAGQAAAQPRAQHNIATSPGPSHWPSYCQ